MQVNLSRWRPSTAAIAGTACTYAISHPAMYLAFTRLPLTLAPAAFYLTPFVAAYTGYMLYQALAQSPAASQYPRASLHGALLGAGIGASVSALLSHLGYVPLLGIAPMALGAILLGLSVGFGVTLVRQRVQERKSATLRHANLQRHAEAQRVDFAKQQVILERQMSSLRDALQDARALLGSEKESRIKEQASAKKVTGELADANAAIKRAVDESNATRAALTHTQAELTKEQTSRVSSEGDVDNLVSMHANRYGTHPDGPEMWRDESSGFFRAEPEQSSKRTL